MSRPQQPPARWAAVMLLLVTLSACSLTGPARGGDPPSTASSGHSGAPATRSSSPASTEQSAAPSSDPAPTQQLPPADPTVTIDVTQFFSPTRNLACGIGDGGGTTGCHVYEHTFPDPAVPPDCEGDLIALLWLDAEGTTTYGQCRGDPFALPSVVLDYGSAAVSGDNTCASESWGMTCWNTATRHGFTVSRDRYTIF